MPTAKRSALYKTGLKVRRAVLGRAYVDRSIRNADEFTEPFQRIITEYAWGAIWARPGLTRKERSMLNLGMLTALGRTDEVALHVRGALNNGLTVDQIREVLLHTMVYCGVPATLESFKVASKVLAEEGVLPATGKPRPKRSRKVRRSGVCVRPRPRSSSSGPWRA